MICYLDKTWCSFYLDCDKGQTCIRALTPEVSKAAEAAHLPICRFLDKPTCFKQTEEE